MTRTARLRQYAAGYYINDKRREAKAQARQIRIAITGLAPAFTASVFNNSDKAVYDLMAETQRMTLTEALVYRRKTLLSGTGQAVKYDSELMSSLHSQYAKMPAPQLDSFMKDDRTLKPDGKVDHSTERPYSVFERYSISFRDQMHRRWRLEYWADDGTSYGDTTLV